MYKPVLVHADIDEGAEARHIRHHAFQSHPGFQIADLLDVVPPRTAEAPTTPYSDRPRRGSRTTLPSPPGSVSAVADPRRADTARLRSTSGRPLLTRRADPVIAARSKWPHARSSPGPGTPAAR